MTETHASSCFEDLIQSSLFTFCIGEEKKHFVVHSEAVAATSEYFHVLVNGKMVEAKTRSAEFQDVKPEDFMRFLEYAYRRDYTVPCCVEDQNGINNDEETSPAAVPEPPAEPPEEPPAFYSYSDAPKHRRRVKVKKSIREKFEERNYLPAGNPSVGMLKDFEPQPNSSPRQDFTPVFLAHARLYDFASMYLVQPLRALALYKLHKTLMSFQLYTRRVSDVLELARYAYDHGSDRKPEGTIDDLRELVVEYIACELDTIGKHKEFKQLIEEGGEFVGDFWDVVRVDLL